MKKFFVKVFICFAITFTLIGCDKLQYGNVTDMQYHPEYTQMSMLLIPISTGKTPILMPVPFLIHHNESWSIDIKGTSKKGKIFTETFYIPKQQFDTLKIGSFVCVEGLCDEDTALHKTRLSR